MDEHLPALKPMYFVVEAVREDLLNVPLPVRKEFGHALYLAQTGAMHQNAKRLHGFGSGVLEVVENYDGDTFRAVYTVRFAEAVYVLHVFQKKSTRGIETPQKELDTIQTRLQRAHQFHEEYVRLQEEEQRSMEDNANPVLVSGNIFADLNIPNAEEELEKAQLGCVIRSIVQANGWTQEEAAKEMGTSQPKVSQIIGGKLAGFTADRLLKYVRALECDVEIRITRKPANREHGSVTVVCTV